MTTLSSDALSDFYHQNSLRWQRIHEVLSPRIAEGLQNAGLSVHQQTSRVKTLDSFLEKASRTTGEDSPRYVDPRVEIEDFVGLRYVVVLAEDIPSIADAVRGCVQVLEEFEHGRESDAGIPGYASLHLVGQLADDDPAVRREPALRGGPCIEIQIRSILQDAFASFSHDLVYKAERRPTPLTNRRMIVLASVLDLADREFARVRAEHLNDLDDVPLAADDDDTGPEVTAAGLCGWTDEQLDSWIRQLVGENEQDPHAWLAELSNVLIELDLGQPDDLTALASAMSGGAELARQARADRPWLRGSQIVDLLLQRALGSRYVERRSRDLDDDQRVELIAALATEWPEAAQSSAS